MLPAAKLAPDVAALITRSRALVFDFDGVFTDNCVWTDQHGVESVRCSRGDGTGIGLLRQANPALHLIVLSSEENAVVTARCRKLKLRAIQGVLDKGTRLRELAAELDIPLSHIAYVGNDVNDRDCLAIVGLPIVVADAHPDVTGLALLQTRCLGGNGAVREICDTFVALHSSHRPVGVATV